MSSKVERTQTCIDICVTLVLFGSSGGGLALEVLCLDQCRCLPYGKPTTWQEKKDGKTVTTRARRLKLQVDIAKEGKGCSTKGLLKGELKLSIFFVSYARKERFHPFNGTAKCFRASRAINDQSLHLAGTLGSTIQQTVRTTRRLSRC